MAASRKWLLSVRRNSIAPFLYQTHTLTGPALRTSYSTTADDNNPDEDTSNASSSSTTNNEPRPRPTFLQKHAAARLSSNQAAGKKSKVAMTRTEKKVIGRLLAELQKLETYPAFAATQGLNKKKSEDGSGGGDEMARLSAIFESALADARGKGKRGGGRRQLRRRLGHGEEEGDEEDEMWAEMTLGEGGESVVDISEILGEEGKQVPMQRAIRIIVKRESEKIETILRKAIKDDKGDIGIWDVCKARIFSMLEHTGPNPAPGLRRRPHQQQGNEHPMLKVPLSVPVEPVVISLYPKMLLVAFRLLNQHYPKSQLINQFRSTIKCHGRASAVLGTSTGLYNELITFYWQGMNDLSGVISILHEMEVIGVDANEQTCHILKEILRQRDRDLKEHWYRRRLVEEGEKVQAREPWWDLAPNRRAVRELLGPEGWVSRLEARVRKRRSV